MAMKLRFTIRDLLWMTLVIVLAVGWWVDHRRLTEPWEPIPQYLIELKLSKDSTIASLEGTISKLGHSRQAAIAAGDANSVATLDKQLDDTRNQINAREKQIMPAIITEIRQELQSGP